MHFFSQVCSTYGKNVLSLRRFSGNHRCPDGGMVDTRDLKSLGLYGCAGSSPAWGTKRRASSSLPSVFVFPCVPLTLLLTLRFASTRPSLATVSRGFASAIYNSVIHTQPFTPLLSTIHLTLPPRLPSILPPFLLPFCCLLKGESHPKACSTPTKIPSRAKYVLCPFLSNYR